MENKIYLDNGATTIIKKEVADIMLPYFYNNYFNPSSIYSEALKNRKVIEECRTKIESILGVSKDTIYFTSGGSESDNFAIKGIAYANKHKGNHIITSKIEHHAVLHTLEYLEKQGFEVTYLDVDSNGFISLEDLENSIKKETILISIMAANNEIGVIQDINQIGIIAHKHNVLFHTDAVQAIGKMEINMNSIDLMSISAHKIHGPKGIGAIYIKKGIKIDNLIHGGAQENNKRAGTENVALIVGFTKAMELIYEDMDNNIKQMQYLRDKLIDGILNNIDKCILNGSRENRLCNNANISFGYVEGESILLMLDKEGIMVSSGSACTSRSLEPSHVIMALGTDYNYAHGSIRFTLSTFTTEEEIDYVLNILPGIIKKLRAMSPIYREDV